MNKKLLFPDIDTSPVLTGTENCSCFEPIWQSGHIIDTSDYDLSNLEFICETLPPDAMTDFAVTDVGCPLVSKKLKNILDAYGVNNIEYFPAKIFAVKGGAFLEYYACNIVGLVNCINFHESVLDLEEEDGEVVDIYEVDTLVLASKSFGYIYRLYLYERVIVLEETLYEDILEKNISGMKLIDPEKWDGFAGEK